MFVSQDHFLIQCKAVAQATFIFAFSNFECSIQQSLKKNKKGTCVRNNCGPGLGGFLGDTHCFSRRNEVLCRSARFFTITAIIVLADNCSSPSPAKTTLWMTSAAEPHCVASLSRGPLRQRALASTQNLLKSISKRLRPASNQNMKSQFKLTG